MVRVIFLITLYVSVRLGVSRRVKGSIIDTPDEHQPRHHCTPNYLANLERPFAMSIAFLGSPFASDETANTIWSTFICLIP